MWFWVHKILSGPNTQNTLFRPGFSFDRYRVISVCLFFNDLDLSIIAQSLGINYYTPSRGPIFGLRLEFRTVMMCMRGRKRFPDYLVRSITQYWAKNKQECIWESSRGLRSMCPLNGRSSAPSTLWSVQICPRVRPRNIFINRIWAECLILTIVSHSA